MRGFLDKVAAREHGFLLDPAVDQGETVTGAMPLIFRKTSEMHWVARSTSGFGSPTTSFAANPRLKVWSTS